MEALVVVERSARPIPPASTVAAATPTHPIRFQNPATAITGEKRATAGGYIGAAKGGGKGGPGGGASGIGGRLPAAITAGPGRAASSSAAARSSAGARRRRIEPAEGGGVGDRRPREWQGGAGERAVSGSACEEEKNSPSGSSGRQEWDARLPTRRQPDSPLLSALFCSPALFRFAVPGAGGSRPPFHLE